MHKYRCHKVVEAGVITGTVNREGNGPSVVLLKSDEEIEVPDNFFARGTPKEGDYLVRYDATIENPEGYLSWSPKAVFEAGYNLIDATG